MAESTLTLGYSDLRAAVGKFLGYTSTSANWTAAQGTEITDIVTSGYRRFLYPAPIAGRLPAHEWSFLKLTSTITTAADDYQYDAPDDFGTLLGEMTYNTDQWYVPVQEVGEGQLRDLRQRGTLTSKPRYVAIANKTFDGSAGQRFEFQLWPTPDAAYTLTYRYSRHVNKLSDSYPYPIGGAAHAETVLECCLWVAEERMEDQQAVHREAAIERLLASIQIDNRNRQQFFGYNADRSTKDLDTVNRVSSVSYNGVTY